MKHIYAAALALSLLATAAAADVKSLDAVYFRQKGSMSSPMMLPCNWDKDISSVTIFGYYGPEGQFQAVISPEALRHDDPASTDIWFKLPASSMHHVDGGELKRVDIDYRTTRRRCQAGFGFRGGVVR